MNKDVIQEEIDKDFIKTENKYKLSYKEVKGVSIDTLRDFKWELDLYNLLWDCCKENDHKLLKWLINCGFDVNIKKLFNETALEYAKKGIVDKRIVDLLIQNGAHE